MADVRPGPARRWLVPDIWGILFISFLGLPLLAVWLVKAGETLGFFSLSGDAPALLIALYFQEAGLLALTLASVALGYRRSWDQIGLRAEGWGTEVLVGLAAVGPLYLLQEGGGAASVWAFRLFVPAQKVAALLAEENAAVTSLFASSRLAAAALSVLLVSMAPLAEEVFFRGFVQEVFRERYGIWPTVLLASGLFAVIHRYQVQLLPVFLVGLALALLYEWRRSLTAGITAHALLNLLALLKLLKDLP
ncbi:MAG: lysostaphin resistance A-like protein [Chitinophagales bacterium]